MHLAILRRKKEKGHAHKCRLSILTLKGSTCAAMCQPSSPNGNSTFCFNISGLSLHDQCFNFTSQDSFLSSLTYTIVTECLCYDIVLFMTQPA